MLLTRRCLCLRQPTLPCLRERQSRSINTAHARLQRRHPLCGKNNDIPLTFPALTKQTKKADMALQSGMSHRQRPWQRCSWRAI